MTDYFWINFSFILSDKPTVLLYHVLLYTHIYTVWLRTKKRYYYMNSLHVFYSYFYLTFGKRIIAVIGQLDYSMTVKCVFHG